MYLDRIVADKREELAKQKAQVSLTALEEAINKQPPPRDFAAALHGPGVRLIAEVKQASPSKGLLSSTFDPARLARTYVKNGAAAISVLTDAKYFQGSLADLAVVKKVAPGVPVLRKDFILEPYQVYESRAHGADAILLIVAILDDADLRALLGLGRELGMACLVEVHREAEVGRALSAGARIIGINNRDLDTMTVDIETTGRLVSLVPPGKTLVSESGLRTRGDIRKLLDWGVNAALIGEALVTAPDAGARIKELFGDKG